MNNEPEITRITVEEARKLPSMTDWARVDAMTDEELTANALSDSDNPPLSEEFFKNAKSMRLKDLVHARKKQVTLRVDADVLEWFKAQGPRYQTHINAVLRAYREATR